MKSGRCDFLNEKWKRDWTLGRQKQKTHTAVGQLFILEDEMEERLSRKISWKIDMWTSFEGHVEFGCKIKGRTCIKTYRCETVWLICRNV